MEGIENATSMAEFGIGINPWVPVLVKHTAGTIEATRRAGNGLLAIGDGWVRHAKTHIDGCLRNATIRVNGELLVDKGHLTVLEDPDVRACAREFGDPDKILSPIGYIYL